MAGKETFSLEIITPVGKLVEGRASYMSAPGAEGEFGVLPGHIDFLTTLQPGEIMYEDEEGKHYLAAGWGYAEVKSDSVIILADSAETPDMIDVERAEQDKEHWVNEIANLPQEDGQVFVSRKKLQRAQIRIDLYNRIKGK